MLFAAIIVRLLAATHLNVRQKQLTNRQHDPLSVIIGMYAVVVVLGFPALWFLPSDGFGMDFWKAVLFAGILDGLGNIFLMLSLRITDLSVFGPLNAFKAILSMLFAAVLIHELPNIWGFLGVVVILGGSLLLAPSNSMGGVDLSKLLRDRGVWYRLISLSLFAWGAVYLKLSVVTGPIWFAFYFWALFGLLLSGVVFAFLRGKEKATICVKQLSKEKCSLLEVGVVNAVMQLSTLYVIGELLVGYALALFQLGMILQVVAGKVVFEEAHFKRRLFASLVMLIGSLVIVYWGR